MQTARKRSGKEGGLYLGKVAAIGPTGLLGEIVATELARRADLVTFPSLENLLERPISRADAVVVWASAWELGEIRNRLREIVPDSADPVLLLVDHRDPHVYLSRLRDLHVERCRLGFAEMFDALAGCLGRDVAAVSAPGAPQSQYV